MPDFILSATQGQGSSVIKVSPSAVNKDSSDHIATVVIRSQTYGTEQRIKLTHKAPVIEYVFTVSPLTITFNRLGGSAAINVEDSYKTFNGTNQEQLGYTVRTNLPKGITYDDSTKSVTCEENLGVATEGTITFTQNESGKTVTVRVSQREANVETEFSVSPTQVSVGMEGGSQSFTVVSRQNVNEAGWEDVPYTVNSSGLPSNMRWTGSQLIIDANPDTTQRTGTLIFNQTGTGDSVTVRITQEALVVSGSIIVGGTVSMALGGSMNAFPMDNGTTLHVSASGGRPTEASTGALGWWMIAEVPTENGEPIEEFSNIQELGQYFLANKGWGELSAASSSDYSVSAPSWVDTTLQNQDYTDTGGWNVRGLPSLIIDVQQNTSTSSREGDITFSVPNNILPQKTWTCHIIQEGAEEKPSPTILVNGKSSDTVEYRNGNSSWKVTAEITSIGSDGEPETPIVDLNGYTFFRSSISTISASEGRYRLTLSVNNLKEFRNHSGNYRIYIRNSYGEVWYQVDLWAPEYYFYWQQGSSTKGNLRSGQWIVVVLEARDLTNTGGSKYTFNLYYQVKASDITGTTSHFEFSTTQHTNYEGWRKPMGELFRVSEVWINATVNGAGTVTDFGSEVTSFVEQTISGNPAHQPVGGYFTVPDNSGDSDSIALPFTLYY